MVDYHGAEGRRVNGVDAGVAAGEPEYFVYLSHFTYIGVLKNRTEGRCLSSAPYFAYFHLINRFKRRFAFQDFRSIFAFFHQRCEPYFSEHIFSLFDEKSPYTH